MIKTASPALTCLLDRFIDYAGVFPPAALPLDSAVANYLSYKNGDYAWMLRWFVVGAGSIAAVPAELDGRLSVVCDNDEPRAASIESKRCLEAVRPVYCEVAPGDETMLDQVKASANFAKIRAGGLKPEAIPSTEAVADFITACASRKLAFKATAGLHHPIRSEQPLTYEPGAVCSTMHGFLNVLLAAAFAWHGEENIEPILSETDAAAFSFDERAHFRDRSLTVEQIRDARQNFIHSVGSCSFEEPVADLKSLGLL